MTIPVTRLSELSTGAQLIIWAMRHMVGAALRECGVPWSVRKSFEIAGALPAYERLQGLILTIARATPRELTVGQPSSGVLTPDEVLMAAALLGEPSPAEMLATDSVFTEDPVVDRLEALRDDMVSAGLPMSRLGMPDVGHLVAGRAPGFHANPGMADLH